MSSPSQAPSNSQSQSHSYFTSPVRYVVSSALRRLSSDPSVSKSNLSKHDISDSTNRKSPAKDQLDDDFQDFQQGSLIDLDTDDPETPFSTKHSFLHPESHIKNKKSNPPTPSASSFSPSPRPAPAPFQPPPLAPLELIGAINSSNVLSRQLAEEIRLLLPARLQLVDSWKLTFSLERDGASLATLYDKCDGFGGKRGGFVVVVKDSSGNTFGAYLSHPPHPSKGHYYGNGECFLWRCSILNSISIPSLASLPLPPSADTTYATRMTTLGSPQNSISAGISGNTPHPSRSNGQSSVLSGTSTPDRIRFKAFPYSGINDYMIFCEQGFLSVGGGDGHYGLWLDASLENGVSSSCPTFGNEPLSDEGTKFEVLDVEIWYLGA